MLGTFFPKEYQLVSALMLVLVFLDVLRLGWAGLKAGAPFFAYVLFGWLSLLWAYDIAHSANQLLQPTRMALFAVAILIVPRDRLLKDVWVSLVALSISVLVLTLYVYLQYGGLRGGYYAPIEARYYGNVVGHVSVLSIPFFVYFFVAYKDPIRKFLCSALIVQHSIIVLVSESRGALILLMLGFLAALYKHRRFVLKGNSVLLSAAIFLAVYVIFTEVGWQSIENTFDRIVGSQLSSVYSVGEATNSELDYERAVVWNYGIKLMSEFPVLGLGWGGFELSLHRVEGISRSAHNIFIASWVELGLIGLLLVLWWQIVSVVKVRRGYRMMVASGNTYGEIFYGLLEICVWIGVGQMMIRAALSNPMLILSFALALRLGIQASKDVLLTKAET